jgi:hypothetical protein
VHDTPPRVAVNDVPDKEQIPDETCHEIKPPDCPPDAESEWVEPVVNDEALVMEKPVCDALLIVMVVFDVLATK